MHMSDALITPSVGGVFWAVSAAVIGYCSSKLKKTLSESIVPLMGVLGAFVFAAQMINFSIPATGSSGHIGGGLLLAMLLGPHAAFIVVCSVLVVQAFFFADGGLLALGCNMFNMGVFPCFIAYPFIYRRIVPAGLSKKLSIGRLWTAAILASVIGLQLGAFAVVLQTKMSGISDLSFGKFLLFMQPIHLAIGVVEGAITAFVASWVLKARPELLAGQQQADSTGGKSFGDVAIGMAAAALLVGCLLSSFASGDPDGLEWSIGKTAGTEELEAPQEGIHERADKLQQTTAFLPDYDFAAGEESADDAEAEGEQAETASAISIGTSVSGLVGGLITLIIAAGLGALLKKRAITQPVENKTE